jgi:hypothetical protein
MHRYFLTMYVQERFPAFVSKEVVESVLLQFLQRAAFNVAILAYCFMPDHARRPCGRNILGSDRARRRMSIRPQDHQCRSRRPGRQSGVTRLIE